MHFFRLIVTSVLLVATFPAIANDRNISGVRAQLIANDEAVIASGLTGNISSLSARAGEFIAKDTVIATIDCEAYKASYDIANAKVNAAQARFDSSQTLFEHSSVGPLEVQVTKAELAMAKAEYRAAKSEIRFCKVLAPFDAVVVKRFANAHQFVSKGDPLVEIYSPNNLEVHVVVPSVWLSWLEQGIEFNLSVDEINQTFQGVVSRIGGTVDTVSQTVEVFGVINLKNTVSDADKENRLLPGMSGTVQFNQEMK